ncbi:hypothetical protein AMTR_s00223p00018020 [Amborella trichopoda]|uniref:Uncharacterized protein n=1 Tax=Amborella trichopoda TaxID=13333 RepID=W1NP06_AMBTC|nr:hypothetical protein AMTR_s00223p00018020 [Amborella trichopoda]
MLNRASRPTDFEIDALNNETRANYLKPTALYSGGVHAGSGSFNKTSSVSRRDWNPQHDEQ